MHDIIALVAKPCQVVSSPIWPATHNFGPDLTEHLQVLLKRNTKPVELPSSGTVRKTKVEDLAPRVNKGTPPVLSQPDSVCFALLKASARLLHARGLPPPQSDNYV